MFCLASSVPSTRISRFREFFDTYDQLIPFGPWRKSPVQCILMFLAVTLGHGHYFSPVSYQLLCFDGSTQEELGEEFSEIAQEIMDVPYVIHYPSEYQVKTWNTGIYPLSLKNPPHGQARRPFVPNPSPLRQGGSTRIPRGEKNQGHCKETRRIHFMPH